MSQNNKKTIVIISISSDIGKFLAKKYSSKGYQIIGTYRSTRNLEELEKIENCSLLYCDLSDKQSIDNFIGGFQKENWKWDTFISCPCNPLPLTSFFESNFEEWNSSIHINAIEQLRVLHKLYAFRNKEKITSVVYFAGGEISKSGANFSAYTVSKMLLIKMCEVLNAENKDINSFIIGPGWTRTKVHKLILDNLTPNAKKYQQTKEFLAKKEGTNMEDIFECIEWLCNQDKRLVGGRNFSVVYDNWGSKELSDNLKSDLDLYKLRRKEK